MNQTIQNQVIQYQNLQDNPLVSLGWNAHFQSHMDGILGQKAPSQTVQAAKEHGLPARVVGVEKNHFIIRSGQGEILARPAGRLLHQPDQMFPVVGDWVITLSGLIQQVLPRKSVLSRAAAGSRGSLDGPHGREQIIAANLDTVFIVCGMDRDFNLRRMERYLTLVYNCGLSPVIVLTKADLHDDPAPFVRRAETIAYGVPVHPVSDKENSGRAELAAYIDPGRTIAMVGSSGAGKSTLVNRLYGEAVQHTAAVSPLLGKGRHTTTRRSLIMLPRGGMVIDNPGIREIGFGESGRGVESAFPDIDLMARECRFQDCTHTHEPGCRVLSAVAEGEISTRRLDSYRKMRREMAYLADREIKSADRIEKERWKGVSLKIKSVKKKKGYR